MNRIEKNFSSLIAANKKAIVPYIMAGDGGLDCLNERLIALEQFGAAAIEIGVPFSDPVADGPTIQQAGIRALKNGTTLKAIIAELEKVRSSITIPFILMTYMNPIYAYGIEAFVNDIRRAGIDGCIIPDLPIEEEEMIAEQLKEAEVELIRLVTLTTPIERIKMIAAKGQGFLYTVTVKGITGERSGFDPELKHFLQAVKDVSPIPVLAGFGISTHEQIKEITEYCDGVIIGSKVVDLLEQGRQTELENLLSIFKQESNII